MNFLQTAYILVTVSLWLLIYLTYFLDEKNENQNSKNNWRPHNLKMTELELESCSLASLLNHNDQILKTKEN